MRRTERRAMALISVLMMYVGPQDIPGVLMSEECMNYLVD